MAKQVLIDYNLFLELIKYHCLEMYDDPTRNLYIKTELEEKVNRLAEHQKYGEKIKNKTSP